MVLNQEKNQESIQFYDNPAGYLFCNKCEGYYELKDSETPEDFETCSCGNVLEFVSTLNELDNPEIKFSENISKKASLVSNLSQKPIAEEILTNIRQDKWSLWNSEQLKSTEEQNDQKLMMDDFVEMNRLMMLVDEKRSIEMGKTSKLESISQKKGLIGFLSTAIILMIVILTLTLPGKMI
ncbi:MAG: hypothetical protein HVN35_06365 [Methanobacteriaceae archaeon]|nr:hypothetical protein [Methanobacteriaceae archaeon]